MPIWLFKVRWLPARLRHWRGYRMAEYVEYNRRVLGNERSESEGAAHRPPL